MAAMLNRWLVTLALPVGILAKECHPMDTEHPKHGDINDCHRECNQFTEWCVPNSMSSTGWACGPAHKRGEAQPGESCVAGGGSVFCSNCPGGYFCQKDTDNGGWECDPLRNSHSSSPLLHSPSIPEAPHSALCSPCFQLGEQALQVLLNYVVNAGVVGGCSTLCSNLKSKGSQTACNLLCDVVGVNEFAKALNKTDLDPIYFCEAVHACDAGGDNASMAVVSVTANPDVILKGDTVQLSVQLNVFQASGVGEFSLEITGPVSQPVSQTFFLPTGIPSGLQGLGVKLTVQDDDSGDTPIVWQPGTYTFTFEICQGECHSKHPHSKVFGRQSSTFILKDSAGMISV